MEILQNLSQICSLMRGGIAERGGIRVGHRIIEINGQSVVATPHDKIIQNLTNAVGEVRSGYMHSLGFFACTFQASTGVYLYLLSTDVRCKSAEVQSWCSSERGK